MVGARDLGYHAKRQKPTSSFPQPNDNVTLISRHNININAIMNPPQYLHPGGLKVNKVVGDMAGDVALLNELLPCVNGMAK